MSPDKIEINFGKNWKDCKKLLDILFQPYLQDAVDFDKIFHTTRKEAYREKAIKSCNRALQLIKSYNVIVPELAAEIQPFLSDFSGEDVDQVLKLVTSLQSPIEYKEIEKWKDHITTCKKTTKECEQYTKLLQSFENKMYRNITNFSKEVYKILVPLLKEL